MLPLLVLSAISAAPSLEPIRVDGVLAHPNHLLVKYDSLSALADLKVVRVISAIHWAVIETPTGQLRTTRHALQRVPGIERVDYDRAAKIAYAPNDAKWGDQWNMRAIKADLAWDTSLGSNSSIVAVMDTGIQVNHPDLAANIWVNPAEIPNNSIDDDGNGYVDDVNGYDFANNDRDPDDDNGHGTACAGLVGGVGDNSIGVSGVAPRTRIMAVKTGLSSGYFYDSATVPAYIYAADMGANVFSMSYYSDRVSQAEDDGLAYAVKHGVLPVAAAGNDSTVYPYYPGAYEQVLSVAAVDGGLNKAGFSDYGSWVDVASPGVSLTTTATGSSYTSGFAGTSGACPQVAGLAGLLFGANPGTTATKVRRAIEDTATLQNQAPFGEFSNYGLVNAEEAMRIVTSNRSARHKASKVAYITPIGWVASDKSVVSRIYGRNLAAAAVSVGGGPISKKRSTRDFVEINLPATSGSYEVSGGSGTIASFDPPLAHDYVYPLIEGSTKGASCFGGFAETLNSDDSALRVTRRSDGACLLEATFRKLPKKGKMTLVIKSKYTNTAQGTESVQLYNWAGASYPYNTFETLSTRTITDGNYLVQSIHIPDIAPYVDFEGTAYLRIVSGDLSSGCELNLDQAYLRRFYH
jgi:subtilisin family serine protease